MTTTTTFNYTGGQQTFTVPDQVTSITATLVGGKGYGGQNPGKTVLTFAVTPGQLLYLFCAGNGTFGSSTSDANGGYNGGGKAFRQHSGALPGSGGGATDIRIGGTALSNRVAVAGGSGGRGGNGSGGQSPYGNGTGGSTGGQGGANTGASGQAGIAPSGSSLVGGDPGLGGTQAAGGARGADNDSTTTASTAGSSGTGGNGDYRVYDSFNPVFGGSGGGGGGGYFGGGGGGQGQYGVPDGSHYATTGGGQGGGGSNFIAATINGAAPTSTSSTQGFAPAYSTGGYIILTYDTKPSVVAGAPDLSHAAKSSGSTNFFATYTDDDATDPAFYQLIIENNSTGVSAYDSTKTAVAGGIYNSTTKQFTIPINLPTYLTANTQYRWKIRAWDAAGLVSDYTAYTVFNYKNPPIFSISPTTGSVLGNGRPTVDWSGATFSMGASQATYRVRFIRTSTSAVLHDSTTVASTATTYTPPLDVLPNAGSYTIEVTLVDSDGLTTVNTVAVTTSYTVPASFNYSITDELDVLGYVLVDWTSAVSDPAFNSWRVYRKTTDDTDWTLIYETTDLGTHTYHDYLISSGQTYQYTVTQSAVVSSVIVESTPGYLSGGVQDTNTYPVAVTQYWIIDPINEDISTVIPIVTSASMVENYEEELYVLIGRGQKKDYGTRLGYSGSLTAQLRGYDGTPAQIRKKLELMKQMQDTYYLRTPFGDLFMVALGQIEFSPVAGVGTYAMYDVTIPFDEVAGTLVQEEAMVTVNITYQLNNASVVDNGDGTSTLTMDQ
jgi:hypothetical protein